MHRIVTFLFSPTPPLWWYCLRAAPLALLPSVALISLVDGALSLAGVDTSKLLPPHDPVDLGEFLGAVVLAPVLETFILGGLLKLLARLSSRPVILASLSAVLWGGLHGLFGPLWFFGTVWSFFVFSSAFLAWRPRSYWHGYAAAAIPHALLNLTVMSVGGLMQ